jgi:hypothetical protein
MTSSKSAESGASPGAHPPFKRKVENMIAAFRGFPENPSRAKSHEARELAPIIDQLLAKYQIGRSSPEEKLREKWAEIVGAANATYSHPLQIAKGGKLHVLASHGVVRSELQLHTDEIIARARALPGCEGITRLVLRQG